MCNLCFRHMGERFDYISLDKIKVQKNNVRTRDIDQGIEDLAENIRANGLIQPIAAYESSNGQYVILTGQRRLNAYNFLNKKYPKEGYDKIQCKVIDEPKSDEKKKALSLAENITQNPMTNLDLVKAVTDLYNIYGDYEMVQQEFGLTKYMVDKYVRLSRLPPAIKDAVQKGAIHSNPKTAEGMALRAVDALNYTPNGSRSEEDVLDLAKEMAGNANSKDLEEAAKRGGSLGDIKDRAKKKRKEHLKIDLATETAAKLHKLADSNGESRELRATQYVVDGVDNDYGELED